MESSTSKGIRLENQVYELISKLVSKDNFYVLGKMSTVHKRKSYYSPKRKENIIFDITIETTLPDAEKYSLLTIIECKNLNKKVTVDDVEEFSSKINQVGEHNSKGIIISTNSFQKSALNLAQSEGIGLIRLNSNNDIQWINYRKHKKSTDTLQYDEEITNQDRLDEPFIAIINKQRLTNLADVLIELSIIDHFKDNEEFIDIPFVAHDRLNHIVTKLYSNHVYDGFALNFDKLTTFLEPKYNVAFKYDQMEQDNYLGKIEFSPPVIKINRIANENVWRFTLAHEIGHLILHSKILKDRILEKHDSEDTLSLKYSLTNKNTERLEIQANLFASYLLLPEQILRPKMMSIFKEYRIHRMQLYLDHQPVNRKEVYDILYKASEIFKVSVQTLKIRLIKLDLLIDDSDKSLGTFIRKMTF